MPTFYKHTQTGYGIFALVSATFLVLGYIAWRQDSWPVLLVLLAVALLVAVFSRLTIELDAEELRVSYAFGWTVKCVALADIASVCEVHTPWYYGWGIRITSDGMLYNVSGTRGVEIHTKSGLRFRLGTDEPHALQAALDSVHKGIQIT